MLQKSNILLIRDAIRVFSAQVHLSSVTQRPNIIQVPKGIITKLETIKKSRGAIKWRGRVFNARPGKELIFAKRKEFNYYQNQTYDKFIPPKLASDGWKHKGSCGDHFTILAYRGNPSVQDSEDGSSKPVDFESLTLNKTLLETLQSMEVSSPTRIQAAAIPSILQGRNVLCAAETGSGKTMTYLLPIIHLLLLDTSKNGTVAKAGRPRCLVLVPAWELAEQTKVVAKTLLANTSLNVRHLDGQKVTKTLKNTFLSPVDILISTPGPILNCLRREFVSLEGVTHIVIDEADTMLDDSFSRSTLNILGRMHVSTLPHSKQKPLCETQMILTGATMPKQAANTLKEILPETALEIIATPHLHRIMPHVNQKFIRLHSQDKAATILGIVTRDCKQRVPVMIFCNEITTCNWLAWFLEESNIKVMRLNGDMDPEISTLLKTLLPDLFSKALRLMKVKLLQERVGIVSSFQTGVSNVLVCTDIGSRGMDMIQVRHVVNFDFPTFMSDYIHRVGRVGRVNSSGIGHVTNFVVQKWDVDLVKAIERAVRVRENLPRVDANIKQKHVRRLVDNDETNMFLR